MLVIGISGQTGAGKSTLAELLSQRGLGENVEVDAIGHDLLSQPAVAHFLVQAFGEQIVVDGSVCRRALGRVAFADAAATEALNNIMHPAMINEVKRRIELAEAAGASAIIINAALLYKMGLASLCQQVIYVRARSEIRLERLIDHRQWSRESARERLFAQDEQPQDDDVILVDNNKTKAELTELAGNLAARLLAQVGSSKLAARYPYTDVEIAEGEQIVFSSPDPEVSPEFLEFLGTIFAPLEEIKAVYLFDSRRASDKEATLVIGLLPSRFLAPLEADRLSFLVMDGVEAHIHDREVIDFMVIDNDELLQIVSTISPQINLQR